MTQCEKEARECKKSCKEVKQKCNMKIECTDARRQQERSVRESIKHNTASGEDI